MMWLGLSIPVLALIGLYMTFSGIFDICKILYLKRIHNQIEKEIKFLKEMEKHDIN